MKPAMTRFRIYRSVGTGPICFGQLVYELFSARILNVVVEDRRPLGYNAVLYLGAAFYAGILLLPLYARQRLVPAAHRAMPAE